MKLIFDTATCWVIMSQRCTVSHWELWSGKMYHETARGNAMQTPIFPSFASVPHLTVRIATEGFSDQVPVHACENRMINKVMLDLNLEMNTRAELVYLIHLIKLGLIQRSPHQKCPLSLIVHISLCSHFVDTQIVEFILIRFLCL